VIGAFSYIMTGTRYITLRRC